MMTTRRPLSIALLLAVLSTIPFETALACAMCGEASINVYKEQLSGALNSMPSAGSSGQSAPPERPAPSQVRRVSPRSSAAEPRGGDAAESRPARPNDVFRSMGR